MCLWRGGKILQVVVTLLLMNMGSGVMWNETKLVKPCRDNYKLLELIRNQKESNKTYISLLQYFEMQVAALTRLVL